MARLPFLLAIWVGVLALAGPSEAHHSFLATYFDDRTQEIEGTVVQFLLRNPHSFLHVEAEDEDGVLQTWSIEWGASNQLNGQGITSSSLRGGDHVIITGSPARNAEDHRMRLVTLSRPADGMTWGGRRGEVVD